MSQGDLPPDEIVVVGTSVWIDYYSDRVTSQTSWLDRRMNSDLIAILDLVLCEVLQGIREERRYALTQARLARLTIFDTCGEDLAIKSANNYRFLRTRGITVRSTIDCLIATFCIREGYALLHNDRDFDPFEQHLGLKVIHPPAAPMH